MVRDVFSANFRILIWFLFYNFFYWRLRQKIWSDRISFMFIGNIYDNRRYISFCSIKEKFWKKGIHINAKSMLQYPEKRYDLFLLKTQMSVYQYLFGKFKELLFPTRGNCHLIANGFSINLQCLVVQDCDGISPM